MTGPQKEAGKTPKWAKGQLDGAEEDIYTLDDHSENMTQNEAHSDKEID